LPVQLRAENLSSHLAQQLLPLYLVSGEETLLVQECCDQIRARARTAGADERQILDAGARDFDWNALLHGASEMSLFAERKLIELRVPSGKPGAEGSKALIEYLALSGTDDILLIVAGKIDKQSQNSKWFKALDGAGAIIQVWPVRSHELPRWMEQRLGAAGLQIDREALQLLCERMEGNLLAAVQEVEKLKLLATNGRVDIDTVTAAVSDNARYNVFGMTDTALQGDAVASLRMLQGLRGEGTEPAVVLWALARELRTLYAAQLDCEQGQSVQRVLGAHKIWKSRMPIMQSALQRLDSNTLADLVDQAAAVDGSIKGYADGRPWDQLERLVTTLCGLR